MSFQCIIDELEININKIYNIRAITEAILQQIDSLISIWKSKSKKFKITIACTQSHKLEYIQVFIQTIERHIDEM